MILFLHCLVFIINNANYATSQPVSDTNSETSRPETDMSMSTNLSSSSEPRSQLHYWVYVEDPHVVPWPSHYHDPPIVTSSRTDEDPDRLFFLVGDYGIGSVDLASGLSTTWLVSTAALQSCGLNRPRFSTIVALHDSLMILASTFTGEPSVIQIDPETGYCQRTFPLRGFLVPFAGIWLAVDENRQQFVTYTVYLATASLISMETGNTLATADMGEHVNVHFDPYTRDYFFGPYESGLRPYWVQRSGIDLSFVRRFIHLQPPKQTVPQMIMFDSVGSVISWSWSGVGYTHPDGTFYSLFNADDYWSIRTTMTQFLNQDIVVVRCQRPSSSNCSLVRYQQHCPAGPDMCLPAPVSWSSSPPVSSSSSSTAPRSSTRVRPVPSSTSHQPSESSSTSSSITSPSGVDPEPSSGHVLPLSTAQSLQSSSTKMEVGSSSSSSSPYCDWPPAQEVSSSSTWSSASVAGLAVGAFVAGALVCGICMYLQVASLGAVWFRKLLFSCGTALVVSSSPRLIDNDACQPGCESELAGFNKLV